jgi:hypothetical protein
MQAAVNGTNANKTDPPYAPATNGDTIVYAFTYNATSGRMLFWDSKNNSTTTNFGPILQDITLGNNLRVGGFNGAQYMDGMIGEVKLYKNEMSGSQLADNGAILTAKWASGGTPYQTWASSYGVGAGTGDPDGDGVLNLAEYALGGNPTNASDRGIQPVIVKVGSLVDYVYPVRTDDLTLTYQVQTRQDIGNAGTWVNFGYTPVGTNVTGGTFNYVTNSITGYNGVSTLSGLTNRTFVRLSISAP